MNNFEVIGEIASSTVFAWSDQRLLNLYLSGKLEYLHGTDENPNRLPTLSPFAIDHAFDPLERELEAVRFDEFPLLPSPLSALYVFADRTSCERAAELHSWSLDEVRQVRVLQHPLVRVHRVNMNLISLMCGLYQGRHLPPDHTRRAICRAYWRSSDELPFQPTDSRLAEPLWELLFEGKFFRTDDPRATMGDVAAAVRRADHVPNEQD